MSNTNDNNASHKKRYYRPRKASGKRTEAPRPAHKNVKKKQASVKIAFLGGLNEVGKNLTVYECQNDIIIVDCGMAFPDQEMPGVDLVIPDFAYLEKNADKIRGVVITHGHEDHIGAIPFLLKKINVPIYGTKLTLGLVEGKLKENGTFEKSTLTVVNPGNKIKLGCFEVEFIHVNHSIPDAVSFAIRSPAGIIVHTGDFKIDSTPIDGDIIDLARLSAIGNEGVLALLSDSTNAERIGYTVSEKKVGESFENLFRRAVGKRLIVASFASNVHRVQQIIDVAKITGRKVALSGRSMENVMTIGTELGYLNIPPGILIDLDDISRFPPEQLVIITTGSQGEPMSALHRMAHGDHRKVSITPEDCIIISATPIPGNEKTVNKVINELMKLGAEVVYERLYEVHVSGHACQEELKLMMSLVKPKFFIPVHGEFKHLRKHAELAYSMGIPKSNTMLLDIGSQIEISKSKMSLIGNVPAGRVMVDGYGVGDVGNIVLKDRRRLAQDGLVVIIATIDKKSGKTVSGPDVVSRGFVYVRESEKLIEDARQTSRSILESCTGKSFHEWNSVKIRLKDEVSRLMYERTKRSPMILPVIMEI